MRGLRVESRNGGDQVLLCVHGELDMATAPDLEVALERALRETARQVVVDLRGVGFMDSTGLALLVRQEQLARAASRRLIIVKGPPQVDQVFELTGVSGFLTLVGEPPC
jgi:anti-sigma B factor antagonist